MRQAALAALTSAALVLTTAGCGRAASEAPRYELTGQILAVRQESREVLIQHQDIPGFMPGMTMPFKVRDPRLLEERLPGDLVTATLVVEEADAWIATLEKTGSAPVPETPASAGLAVNLDMLEIGERVPGTSLLDQDGQSLTLDQWPGSVVAVTFIYTRCPLPQYCPLMDRRFAEVQQQVRADPSLSSRSRLLSISFDPDNDTQEVLRAHASKLGADPALWRFATAPTSDVDTLASSFGVSVIREEDGTITHNLRTAVIGPDGRVAAFHTGNDWTAVTLVEDLREALARSTP